MKRYRTRLVFLAAALLLAPTMKAHAVVERIAVAAKASTMGLGGDLIVQLLPQVNARLGINGLSTRLDLNLEDVDYEVDFSLLSYTAIVDWHLFDTPFRISGGVVANKNRASMAADIAATYQIGSTRYTQAEVGALSARLTYDEEIAPYVGVGWGNAFDQDGRVGLLCDFGLIYTDRPTITMAATGTLSGSPGFQADLATEQQNIEDDLDMIRFYPLLAVSLFFRF